MTREQMIVFGFVVAAFVAGWIASFATRRRARSEEDPPPPAHPGEPALAPGPDDPAPLAEEVGRALGSDAANDGMLSVVRAGRDTSLSALELDLADWGFTYGVAWARARERAPAGPDGVVAQEALDAAEQVFRAYTGGEDWTRRTVQDRANGEPAAPRTASRPNRE